MANWKFLLNNSVAILTHLLYSSAQFVQHMGSAPLSPSFPRRYLKLEESNELYCAAASAGFYVVACCFDICCALASARPEFRYTRRYHSSRQHEGAGWTAWLRASS